MKTINCHQLQTQEAQNWIFVAKIDREKKENK